MLLEPIVLIAMVVGISRIASTDGQSTVLWTAVAIVAGLACMAIPIPFLRVLLAGIGCFVAMTIYKVVKER